MARLGALAIVILLAAAPGCVRVAPWQREHLAKPIMSLEEDPEEVVLEQPLLQAREGSIGGFGEAGGGCGCN